MKAELDFATWAARDYIRLPFIHADAKVLEIGPGPHPLRRADVYVDVDAETVQGLRDAGKEAHLANACDGLSQFTDKQFDFCFSAHTLEHIIDLPEACAAISRVAKQGMIVLPSFAKDSMFNFEESDHFWHVLPNPTHGRPPIFVEHNSGFLKRLRDPMLQKATSFLYRTGTQHDCTAERYMRAWFQQHEPDLDVVYEWTGELKVIAIR